MGMVHKWLNQTTINQILNTDVDHVVVSSIMLKCVFCYCVGNNEVGSHLIDTSKM